MKLLIKNIACGLFAVTVLFSLYSCKKDVDSEKEWGMAKVYMPQATVLNGGTNNNYPVPISAPFKNYIVDTTANTIKVVLGVARTGLQSQEAYTVKVGADMEATNKVIAGGSVSKGVVLPTSIYSLPAEVSVGKGQREAIFYLTIDRKALLEKYPLYYANKMVLVVNISDPSRYELNPERSATTIIIDGKAFMPTPPVVNLIKGGDLETADESFWTKMGTGNREFGYTADKPTGAAGGNLRLYWNDATDVNGTIYQAVQVEPGQKYELSAKVKVPGGGNQFWLLFMVSDVVPGTSTWKEENNAFMGINTWWKCGTTPLNGDIRQVGCEGQGFFGNGIASKGVFTATKSTMYIAIQLGKWQGTFGGNILVDDVKLIRVD